MTNATISSLNEPIHIAYNQPLSRLLALHGTIQYKIPHGWSCL